jgi:hypothetical protein
LEKEKQTQEHTSFLFVSRIKGGVGVRKMVRSTNLTPKTNKNSPTEKDLPKKLNFVLDSGASEFMFSDTKFASHNNLRRTTITTAAAEINGKVGEVKPCFFPSGVEVRVGKNGTAVFSNELKDNLFSWEDL